MLYSRRGGELSPASLFLDNDLDPDRQSPACPGPFNFYRKCTVEFIPLVWPKSLYAYKLPGWLSLCGGEFPCEPFLVQLSAHVKERMAHPPSQLNNKLPSGLDETTWVYLKDTGTVGEEDGLHGTAKKAIQIGMEGCRTALVQAQWDTKWLQAIPRP